MMKNLLFNKNLANLDILELQELSNKFKKKKFKKNTLRKNITISISSDYLTDYFADILEVFLFNKDIYPIISKSDFGDLKYQIKNMSSDFWKKKCDFYILFPSFRSFSYFPKVGDSKEIIKKKANQEAKQWLKFWNNISGNIIQTTFDPPLTPGLSSEDSVIFGGHNHFVRLVNSILIEKLPGHVNLVDVESLIFKNKYSSWDDSRLFFLAKQPFSMETIPALTNSICGKILGVLGLSKKVIVLDLDNTLWGGIAGDDGLEGINLDINSPVGEAFLEFQKYLKGLSNNGIILCINSKNDPKIVEEIFKKHDQIILKLEDFTIIKTNFDDKAKNIKEISKTLNLGLDSFVFIDDSKIECTLVKKKLPNVFVINLDSNEPSNFIKEVESHSLFYFRNLNSEDLNRKKSYKNIEQLNIIKSNSSNLEKFLKDLNPTIKLESINKLNISRAAQLLAKTNQFKFNSNLFSEKDLEKLKKDIIIISFKDDIQNYGIIGVLVKKFYIEENIMEIKNWVLSCRIFSRRIEHFLMSYLIKEAKRLKIKKINFVFDLTKKNKYLQLFLKKIGIKLKKDKKNYSTNVSSIKNNIKNYIKLEN